MQLLVQKQLLEGLCYPGGVTVRKWAVRYLVKVIQEC